MVVVEVEEKVVVVEVDVEVVVVVVVNLLCFSILAEAPWLSPMFTPGSSTMGIT